MGNRTAKVLAVSAVWAPYLASSIFLFRAMLAACGPGSLALSAAAWLLGAVIACFSTMTIIREIQWVHDSDKTFLMILVCVVWMLLWLLETDARKLLIGDSAMCTYGSAIVLFAWIAGTLGTFFATEGLIYSQQQR